MFIINCVSFYLEAELQPCFFLLLVGPGVMLTNSSSPLWEARVAMERRVVFLAGPVEEWFEPPSQECTFKCFNHPPGHGGTHL